MKVMMRVVVVMVMMMYIKEERNSCWFCSWTHTPTMTVSQYVIAGPLQVLPIQLLTTALRKMYAMLS